MAHYNKVYQTILDTSSEINCNSSILFRLEHLDAQWKVILGMGEPDEKDSLIVLS